MKRMNPFDPARSRHLRLATSIVLVVACATGILAASTAGDSPQQEGANVKKSFVLIFRKGSRELTPEEQRRRTDDVRAWALQEGKVHELEPRVLGDQRYNLGDSVAESSSDRTVIALNFIRAADFDEAVKIAKSHPGLRYGVSIEVRPWADPRAQAGRQ